MRSKNEKNDVFLKNKKNEKTDFELYFTYAILWLYDPSYAIIKVLKHFQNEK